MKRDIFETIWQNGEDATRPTLRAEKHFGAPVSCINNDLQTGVVSYVIKDVRQQERK